MNRRGFLSAFLGAAVLDPERLLWVPGQKLITIPNNMEVRRVLAGTYYYREVEILPEWREQWIQPSRDVRSIDWYDGKLKIAAVANEPQPGISIRFHRDPANIPPGFRQTVDGYYVELFPNA